MKVQRSHTHLIHPLALYNTPYQPILSTHPINYHPTDVVIKVQRPDVMNKVALDLHLLHQAAPMVKSVLRINSDLVGKHYPSPWFISEPSFISVLLFVFPPPISPHLMVTDQL